MRNKIAITGHTGFIGKNLINRLTKLNFEIFFIDKNLENLLELIEFDPDYICHMGAEIYDDNKMFDSNVVATYKLLDATKNINYKLFINCGSSSEYGRKIHPMSESDILEPQTMYEGTKSACTMICRSFSYTYKKPIVTIRPFSVYGRFEKPHRFIPTLFNRFETKQPVTISPGVHDFIHIDDFIDGMISIMFSTNIELGDVINLGTGIQYTNLEVYKILSKIYKYEIDIDLIDARLRTFDSNNWVADISKAKKQFGFQPVYDLESGLYQCYIERKNGSN